MKTFHAFVLAGVLSATGTAAMAATGALSPFTPKVLPVLVQVNSAGKVTSASPAIPLSPRFDRLLAKNLNEMISKPAYENGRAVASQFVINLALQATPREQGDYDAQFVYVSTAPVPIGTWHWVNIEGRRFALAGSNNLNSNDRLFFNGDRSGNNASNVGNFQPSTNASPQNSSPSPSSTGHNK
ncbi:hypothetical protein [Dyella sp. 20L07]|uniref:hypothetical protein n=1 Tax=Dyella sp. 20L07 TaxID=3384240 RepID=UPI003D29EEBE